jgi:acetyltransferase-like isoleucine patch superfamily enzyme
MKFKNFWVKPKKPVNSKKIGQSDISWGRFSYGVDHLIIKQWGEGAALKVGSFCSIASSVTVFLGGNHRLDWITTFPFGHVFQAELGGVDTLGHPATNGDVVIGDDVWIGHGATIMSGLTIGSGAVIAANANVVKNVMPYEVVGGNPAQVIKKRFDAEVIDLLMTLKWWDLPVGDIKQIRSTLSAKPNTDSLHELITKYRRVQGAN